MRTSRHFILDSGQACSAVKSIRGKQNNLDYLTPLKLGWQAAPKNARDNLSQRGISGALPWFSAVSRVIVSRELSVRFLDSSLFSARVAMTKGQSARSLPLSARRHATSAS